ncbi:glycosyltransferase family 4 protein [Iamia sp. SCSIO 61187]|uniref:glycosyltransferase n=1 Tax=Iamia sp. SCSIO 61187 TaxID=2722752 RepID=UPI001C629922|nr:glycosyltransferase [Iamia sp. SCSIO 61187]QYG92349.1 glycosyltransferase family 4 protein [Iamia sp. SCSIO 61187]
MTNGRSEHGEANVDSCPPSIQVAVVMRRPLPGQVSIERSFEAMFPPLRELVRLEVEVAPHHSSGVIARLRNILFVARLDAQVVHVAGDIQYCAIGVRKRRCLLTVLDLASLHRLSGVRRKVVSAIWYRWPLRQAARVTVLSESVSNEIGREYPASLKKVAVVPCAVPRLNIDREGTGEQAEIDRDEAHSPTVLIVGTAPNKNVAAMLRAISDVGVRVRIVGKLSESDAALLRSLELDATVVSDLTDSEIVNEYLGTDALLFASTYEGFGLPIVEAQQLGLPVVTSRRAPMDSIAGTGAVLVDPDDVASIAEGLRLALYDEDERLRLVAEGRKNAQRYSPANVAQQYANLYRAVAARSRV